MVVLAVGDIVSKSGLSMLKNNLRAFKKLKAIDFIIVNGENANGIGITPSQAEEIFDAGADVITLGNHTFKRTEIRTFLEDNPYILRPSNYAPQLPGKGYGVYEMKGEKIAVLNLIGRCMMDFGPDNPFLEVDKILKTLECNIIFVDFHAQATSEKLAMGYYLDGRVSAVFGTHTHVQTADEKILSKGTGYITDIGMTGPYYSVLGVKPEQSIAMFRGDLAERFEAADGDSFLNGALFEVDNKTGKCLRVERISLK